ncbi:MAG: DUF2283 domain-containing protein [Methylococcales bacterium]|nr:DUF2283 domain-containing protein [Methylococcales bacterium]
MNNPTMRYFPEQDIIHLLISDEEEMESMEISPNITAELNANGELCGVEILKASTFLRDFILESTQAKLMQLQQASYTNNLIKSHD